MSHNIKLWLTAEFNTDEVFDAQVFQEDSGERGSFKQERNVCAQLSMECGEVKVRGLLIKKCCIPNIFCTQNKGQGMLINTQINVICIFSSFCTDWRWWWTYCLHGIEEAPACRCFQSQAYGRPPAPEIWQGESLYGSGSLNHSPWKIKPRRRRRDDQNNQERKREECRKCSAGQCPLPFVTVSVAVALVFGVHTVLLQATRTLPASLWSSTPISLNLSSIWTSDPPAERWAICDRETHVIMTFKLLTDTWFRGFSSINVHAATTSFTLEPAPIRY